MTQVIDRSLNTIPATPFEFGGKAGRKFLPVKIACEFSCILDCEPCGQPFSYLAHEGMVISLQFRFPDLYNTNAELPEYGWQIDDSPTFWLTADVMNLDGSIAIEGVTNFDNYGSTGIVSGLAVGFDGASYQNLTLLVNEDFISRLSGDCFYIRVSACLAQPDITFIIAQGIGVLPPLSDVDRGDYWIDESGVVYVASPGGWAILAAQPVEDSYAWIVSEGSFYQVDDSQNWTLTNETAQYTSGECPATRECFSPVFSSKSCADTLCFESKPAIDSDCAGNYYGLEGSSAWAQHSSPILLLPYAERFCIAGSLERVGFNIVRETTSRGRVIEERSESLYRLRAIVPELVAERVKNAMLPQGFTINGITFDTVGSISKDNEDGSDWHLDIELTVRDCDNVGGCL